MVALVIRLLNRFQVPAGTIVRLITPNTLSSRWARAESHDTLGRTNAKKDRYECGIVDIPAQLKRPPPTHCQPSLLLPTILPLILQDHFTYHVLGLVCTDMVLIHQQLDRAVQAALVPSLDIITVVFLVLSLTSAIDCEMDIMMCRTDSSSALISDVRWIRRDRQDHRWGCMGICRHLRVPRTRRGFISP